ncbi:MAG TPA: M23 family metallopeptidase [Myxococcales bacterium]|nr:M23 family metallopeptidase [Myxococcales bacterium]HIL99946.1 M23 family metallopeptidase [Myxococcales bacterium]
MKQYTLMLIGDETSPIRRVQVSGDRVKHLAWAAGALVLITLVGAVDYYRTKLDNSELAALRVQSVEQTTEMDRVQATFDEMTEKMAAVLELERKVRIIANLPGASAIGGEGITEVVPDGSVAPDADDDNLQMPVGVPIPTNELGAAARQGQNGDMIPTRAGRGVDMTGLTTEKARAMRQLEELGKAIAMSADLRTSAMEELVIQLEDKHTRLTSMPSIWPTRGWLTSRFGPRISPFTGRRQHHAGIDIAAASGADIVAAASGRVVFVGRKGPLGKSVVVDHGFGVRTLYGHAKELFVKAGDELDRGAKIASVGSTGRSTGPHVHYVVEVNGKAKNPLDYIFD